MSTFPVTVYALQFAVGVLRADYYTNDDELLFNENFAMMQMVKATRESYQRF